MSIENILDQLIKEAAGSESHLTAARKGSKKYRDRFKFGKKGKPEGINMTDARRASLKYRDRFGDAGGPLEGGRGGSAGRRLMSALKDLLSREGGGGKPYGISRSDVLKGSKKYRGRYNFGKAGKPEGISLTDARKASKKYSDRFPKG